MNERRPARFTSIASILSLALLALAGAEPVLAQGKPWVWIASGTAGGTYRNVYATNLEKQLRSYNVLHRDTSGSGENLDLLLAGKADIAFVQADVYAARSKLNRAQYDSLRVLGKLGDECIFIAHRKKGPPANLTELSKPIGGREPRVAVGPKNGGMASTWEYLVSLQPGLVSAKPVYEGDVLALNQLSVGLFDAVTWVTDPTNYDHSLLKAVAVNSDIQLMDLASSKLGERLPDGTTVYTRRDVKTNSAWNARTVSTLCTSALVMARKNADPKLVTRVAELVGLHRDLLVPRQAK